MTRSRWIVYIVRARSGALYTGITTDLARRFGEHEGGRRGAKFFRTSPPAVVLLAETHPTRAAASAREREIKGLTRRDKLALIRAVGPAQGPPLTE